MKKQLITLAALIAVTFGAKAQTDSTSTPLEISGSVDAYYKYDFAKTANIGTSFASDQNSVSLGMIDIALKKTTGKASFVGEVSFGPRGQGQSILPQEGIGESFHIQNLYATYAFTDKFSMTAGFMGTFVGYEVISPVGNFNYSTSYLFTNGPFQNAGIKANYAISDKVGVMVGLFNDTWNTYIANPSFGVNTLGAQISLAPVEGWNAYLNVLSGSESGTILDLTTAYQISEKFKLGLNAADWSGVGDDEGYTGVALYPSVSITESFGLGLRGEYFKSKKNATALFGLPVADESVTALTLTANLKSGGLTFIPEFRLDNGSTTQFLKSNGAATKSASQFSLAVVYAF
ncbi:outer membrane beta-barrel protein [Pedobacter alpinus]|uniref:Outer membrane beta-barrel protein n=1 Tax=Pedobacter alpinus TaxID=1590643 RepID=A0ABW5TRR5_9SPHI